MSGDDVPIRTPTSTMFWTFKTPIGTSSIHYLTLTNVPQPYINAEVPAPSSSDPLDTIELSFRERLEEIYELRKKNIKTPGHLKK